MWALRSRTWSSFDPHLLSTAAVGVHCFPTVGVLASALGDDDGDGAAKAGRLAGPSSVGPKSRVVAMVYEREPGVPQRVDDADVAGTLVDFAVFLHRVLLIISHRWVTRGWCGRGVAA